MELRHLRELSGLGKICIKGENAHQPQAHHHGETGAIGKAESFVIISFEEVPGNPFIVTGYPYDTGQLPIP